MAPMNASLLRRHTKPDLLALMVCAAATLSLAVAMGVGRFAFTPLFPLMVRDGLLNGEAGALLAASNYLGYLAGALVAARIKFRSEALLALGLLCTVAVTAGMGWTSSFSSWATLRFIAGVMSAWTLVATSAWGLGWLASLGRLHMSGAIFAGVGLGIAAVGMFCLVAAGTETSSLEIWIKLALMAAIAVLIPLAISWHLRVPNPRANTPAIHTSPPSARPLPSGTLGLIVCYSLFGFGYILPATYLPSIARQLVDDPHVFGWAWPLFGMAAALSTVVVSWGMKNANPLRVWAASHLLMGIGVVLPSIWTSFISIAIAALLVGSTFMVITMVGLQEARTRAQDNATAVLGWMTAGFAFGQLMGPVSSAAIGRFTADYAVALDYALAMAAAGLFLSAFYLWRQVPRHGLFTKEHTYE
jgi:MFS family permease